LAACQPPVLRAQVGPCCEKSDPHVKHHGSTSHIHGGHSPALTNTVLPAGVVLPEGKQSAAQRRKEADKNLRVNCGVDLVNGPLQLVDREHHVFSHVVWTIHVEKVRVTGRVSELVNSRAKNQGREMKWVSWREVENLGLPTAVKKVWKVVM
jgi:adenine-specific DNA glycosylase